MSGGKSWYEVRVRVKIGPDKWMKKSKFYIANSSAHAASKYKGPGMIMSAEKVQRERALKVREYFPKLVDFPFRIS